MKFLNILYRKIEKYRYHKLGKTSKEENLNLIKALPSVSQFRHLTQKKKKEHEAQEFVAITSSVFGTNCHPHE